MRAVERNGGSGRRLMVSVCVVLVCCACAQATTTVVFSTSDSQFTPGVDNQGWWSDTLSNRDDNTNYATGVSPNGEFSRSFFSFDLSSLALEVTSAELRLTRYEYASSAESELLGLFDVSTDAAVLNNNVGTNATIFDDLGSGVSYGEFEVFEANEPSDVLSFVLNAAAIDAINAASGGWFSIGGSLQSFGSPAADGTELIFGLHGSPCAQQLVVEVVPEPATITLLAIGAILIRKR